MTLTHLLRIDRKLVRRECEKGLYLAERIWSEAGQPTERRLLCDTLEVILDRCMASGVLFPPVLLKRKKELERGTWKPDLPGTGNISLSPETGSDCPECRGTGYVVRAGGGSATLCKCAAWKRTFSPSGAN
jgi:hypothetical protein